MRKILMTILLITVAVCNAQAITVDGDLSDWGVTPGSDWEPDIPGVESIVEDWPVSESKSPGIEECDVEAFYVLDGYKIGEPNYVYFAVVLSMPPNGTDYYGHRLITGDLALDPDNDGDYEYGVKLTDGVYCDSGSGSDCDCNAETCTVDGSLGDIYEVTEWGLINPARISQDNWDWANIISGNKVGKSENISYVMISWTDNPDKPNYVIEIKMSKSQIGMRGKGTANLVSLVSCTNDVAKIIKFQYEIPEFVTLAIPAVLIIGMLYFFRR